MKKLLASAMLAFSFLVTSASAWSLQEAHKFSNEVLVQVGAWCSGTVIDRYQGLVTTAAHCTQQFTTTLNTRKETSDGKVVNVAVRISVPQTLTIEAFSDEGDLFRISKYTAILLGSDTDSDVAILKITSSLRSLSNQATLSTTNPKFGDKIYTITNPLILAGVVTEGAISKPKVIIPVSTLPLIQFTATIAPGSSGGGLYNNGGELIGITNWGTQGLYWATSVNNVRALLNKLHLTIGPQS